MSHLRELDASVADLTGHCLGRFEAGGAVAAAEADTHTPLAEAIAGHVAEWLGLVAPLELAAHFDAARAGALLLESVFDDILAPPAWRVLAAALAVAAE